MCTVNVEPPGALGPAGAPWCSTARDLPGAPGCSTGLAVINGQEVQGILPLAGFKGLGEDVSCLQLGVYVLKTAVGLVYHLLNAANVDFIFNFGAFATLLMHLDKPKHNPLFPFAFTATVNG